MRLAQLYVVHSLIVVYAATDLIHSTEHDNADMQVLSKAYLGRLEQIFEQTQHLASASSHAQIDKEAEAGSTIATAQAIAAMVSDGPALGMSAGNTLSAEIAEFLQGMDETERARKSFCRVGSVLRFRC